MDAAARGRVVLRRAPGHRRAAPDGRDDAPAGKLPEAALGDLADGVDRVLLVYLDALGWHDVEPHGAHPLLRRFLRDGRTSVLTTRWPSTTSVCVTTIHTGLSPEEHGVASGSATTRRSTG